MTIARLAWYSTVMFVTDCLPVHNVIVDHRCTGANADLWCHLCELVDNKKFTVQVRQIKTDLDKTTWLIDTMGFSRRDVCGHFAADALAGQAGKKARPLNSDTQDCMLYPIVVQQIQRRLVTPVPEL